MFDIVFACCGELTDKVRPVCYYFRSALTIIDLPAGGVSNHNCIKTSALLTALKARGCNVASVRRKEARSPYPLSRDTGWDLTSGVDLCS